MDNRTVRGERPAPPVSFETDPPSAVIQAPNQKVTAGALAGALGVLLAFLYQSVSGRDLPAEVAIALTALLSFLVSYFVPESPSNNVVDPRYPESRRVAVEIVESIRELMRENGGPPALNPEVEPEPYRAYFEPRG